MKRNCCGCLVAFSLAILILVVGFFVLAILSPGTGGYAGNPPAGSVNYGNQTIPPDGTVIELLGLDQPWGYSSRLYLVLSKRVGNYFSDWVDTINRDVITYWVKYSETNPNLYGGRIVAPANIDVRRIVNRKITCANEVISNSGNGIYCGGEDFVALDFDQYENMVNRFGPIVLMFGLSHEWGHAQQRYMTFDHRQMSDIDREKQADCFSGTYIHSRYYKAPNIFLTYSVNGKTYPPIGETDLDGIKLFLNWLTPSSYGYDRYSWYLQGFNNGVSACLALAP